MEEPNISVELDGGMFGLTFPSGWGGWIVFVLGFIISVVGIITLFISIDKVQPLPILTAVGVLIMGF